MNQGRFSFIDECRIHTSPDKIKLSIWRYLLGLFVRDRKRRGELIVGFAKRLIIDKVRYSFLISRWG